METVAINFAVTSHFQPFIQDVTRATNAVGRLQAANSALVATNSKAASTSFANALTQGGAFYQNQVRIRSEAGKLGDTLSKRKLGLGESVNAMKQWRQEQGAITQLAQKQVRLQQSLVSGISKNAKGHITADIFTPSQVSALGTGPGSIPARTLVATERMRIFREVAHQGAESMVNLGKNTQWAGRQMMVGLSLPIAIFAGAATAAFMKMDQQLVRIQKVYGSGLNFGEKFVEQGKMVREEATKLAAELAKSMGAAPTETLGIMADIAATGKEGKALTDATRETTRLSILGEVERQQAMKSTLALQSAFKQNTIELTQSIDFMNAVENQTSTSLNDLTEAIPRAGATIHNLGGGIKELSLFMTAMREGGVAAGEGANALKSGLASMIAPSNDAQKTLEKMGISIRGIADKNQGNLVGMITEFGAAFRKLGQNDKTEAMTKMFGRFQYNKMAALFNNIGVEGSQTIKVLELMGMKVEDLAKISSQELATVTESASGKFKRALNSMKMSLAEIGKGFAGPLTAIVGFFSKIMSAISGLGDGTKEFLKWGLIITALVGPVVMITGVLLNFFGTLAKGVVALAGFFAAGKGGRWSAWTAEMSGAKAMANSMTQPFEKVTGQMTLMATALERVIVDLQKLPGVGLAAGSAMAAMTGAALGMPKTGANAAVTGTVAQRAKANNLAGGESWNIGTMQALGPQRLAAIKMSQDIMQDPKGLTQFSGMTKKRMETLMVAARTDTDAANSLNKLMQKYMYSTEMQTKWGNEVAAATSATKQYAANVMAQAAALGAVGTGNHQRAWRSMISGAGSMLLEDKSNRGNADLRKAIPMAPTDLNGPRINTLDKTTQAGHIVSRADLWSINQAKLNNDTVALGQIFDKLGISANAEKTALLAAAQSAETLIQAEARLAASSNRLATLQDAAAPKISLAGSPGSAGIKVNANGQAAYATGMRAFAQKQLTAAGVDAALHDQILNQARNELKDGATKSQLTKKINQILSEYVIVEGETLVREKEVAALTSSKAALTKKVLALQEEEALLRAQENAEIEKQVAAEKAAARNALIQSRMRKGSATLGAAGMMGMMIPQQKGTDGGAMATSALSAGGMGAMFGSMLPGQAGVIGSFVGAALGVTFGIWRKMDEAAKNASKAVLDMAVAFNKATAGFNQEALKALGAPDKDLTGKKNTLTAQAGFSGYASDPKFGSEMQKMVDQYGKDQIEALKKLDDSQALDAAQTMYQQLINNNVPARKAKEFMDQIAIQAGKANIVLKLGMGLDSNIKPEQAFKMTLLSAQQNVDSMLKNDEKLRGDDLVKTYAEAGKQYGARTAEAFQAGIDTGVISNKKNNISSSIREIITGGADKARLEISKVDDYNVRDRLGLPRDADIERVKLAYINASSKVRKEIDDSVGESTRYSLQALYATSDETAKAMLSKLPVAVQAVADLLRTTGEGMSTSSAMSLAAAATMDTAFTKIIDDIGKTAGGIDGFENALRTAQQKFPQYKEELAAYGTAVGNVSHQFDGLRQRVGSDNKWQASIDTSSIQLARLEVKGFAVDWRSLQEAPNQQTFDIIVREQRIQAGKQLIQTAALALIPNNPEDVAAAGAADNKDAQKAAADQQKAAQKALDNDQKAMEAAQKAREKDIENVKKYYDDQIEALQKTEEARQKAFDAEEKRNERNKTLRELQLNYMKAVAKGDTFGAIGAKMAIEGQQNAWGREDQNTNAKDAAQAKIDALTEERDAKTTAMQEQLDAQKEADSAMIESRREALAAQTEANQSALDAQQAATAAAQTAAVDSYDQTSAKITAILDNDVDYKNLNEKMTAIAALLKLPVATVRQQMEEQVGKASWLGKDIVKGIFDNFMNAPWSQLADGVAQVLLGMSPDQAFANIQLPTGSGLKPGGSTFSDARGSYDSDQSSNGYAVDSFGGSTKLDTTPWINTRQSRYPWESTLNQDGTVSTGYGNASGGHISGPGTGTSDSIPAWLSNGEYVVKAKAVGKYGKAFLDHVNAGKFADGGEVGAGVGAGVMGSGNAAVGAGVGGSGKKGGGIGGGMFSRLIDQVIGELTAKLEQAIIPVIMSIGEMRVTMDAQAIASDQLLSIQKTLSFDTQMLQMQKLFAQFQIIETRMRADQAYTIALQVINLTRLAQANSKIVNTMTAQWKQWSTQTVADIKLVGQTLVDTFTSINYGELVKMVEAYASGKTAEGDAAKANVLKKANGGYISGPGTGTSDSIPARLSNGEYVIRQSSVARYGTGFLNQVNEGRYQRYADGGLVGAIGETVSNALNKQAQEKIQAAIDAKAAVMSAASVNGTENLTPEQKAAMILRSQKDLGATHAAINADQSHNGLYYQGSGNAHAVGWAGLPFWGVNDIGNAGQTVFAYASGNVLHAGPFENGSYSPGSTVDIEHLNGGQTRYAHLASVAVQPGATVKAGDVLGVAGSDHLHFEWKYMPSLNQREAGGTPPWMHLGGLIEFAKQGGFYSRGLDQMFKANRIGANPAKWDLQTRTPTAGTGLIPYDGAPPPPFAGDVNSLRHPNGGPFDPNVLRWAGIVQQVLAELNLSSGYITGILAQIQQESGGDPNSVNTTDSNAQKGYASFGLMQTIAGTFNSWAKTPGAVSKKDVGSPYGPQDWTAGMTDPYQNIYAGINYALHNYGEGKFALWNSGQNQAYAAGGPVNGRGTSKSDSIPARLSNGEYVIQANSVSKYGTGLFDALNAGRFATGGPVNKNFLDEKEKADTKARSEAKAKALAETPKNVGLVSTVALMLSDLTNLGRKSMEKEKVAAAAAKKDGTATTDGKVEIKDGLLYGVTSQTIVEHAKKALGTPYSTGQRAGGPGVGFDCSSFAYWAYEGYPGLMKNGWGSPEGVGWTGTLTGEGKPRDMGAIKAGDILLHNPESTGGHAALYIGNGQIQHSANPNKIDSVDVWGGFEQARQILAMANGGLVIPALRKGATINYDNTLANLHKGETVLTNPLTKKLNEGINDLASGGDVSYNVSVNINKANATAAEIEQAVYSALDKKETKAGRSRVVGARR